MTDVRGSWSEVGDRIAALALKLKLHVEEERSERDGDVDDAIGRVRAQIDDVLDALGDATKDPGVRDDVKVVIERLGAAFEATLAEARRAMERRSP
jgi:hypothetical protein